MKQERLNLYRIDMKYIRNLHNADNRVSSVSPQIGKQHRIYVGIVVVCNDKKYLIPLSHPVEKHKKMVPRADFDKIIDKHGKLLGVLNYNLMIPVEEPQLIENSNKDYDTIIFIQTVNNHLRRSLVVYSLSIYVIDSLIYNSVPLTLLIVFKVFLAPFRI